MIQMGSGKTYLKECFNDCRGIYFNIFLRRNRYKYF